MVRSIDLSVDAKCGWLMRMRIHTVGFLRQGNLTDLSEIKCNF